MRVPPSFTACAALLSALAAYLAGCDLDCRLLQAEFDDLVRDHQRCDQDSDCAAAGGAPSCECSPFLRTEHGNAFHRSVRERAWEITHEFWSEGCEPKLCDAGGPWGAECREGRCRVSEWSPCHGLDGFDGWPPEDEEDGPAGDAGSGDEEDADDPS